MEWILLVITCDLRGMDKDWRDKGRGEGRGKGGGRQMLRGSKEEEI